MRSLVVVLGVTLGLTGSAALVAAKSAQEEPDECVGEKISCDRTKITWTKLRYGHGIFSGQLVNERVCRAGRTVTIYAQTQSNRPPQSLATVRTSKNGRFSAEVDYKDEADRQADTIATIPPGGLPPGAGIPSPLPEIVYALTLDKRVTTTRAVKKTAKAKKSKLLCKAYLSPRYTQNISP